MNEPETLPAATEGRDQVPASSPTTAPGTGSRPRSRVAARRPFEALSEAGLSAGSQVASFQSRNHIDHYQVNEYQVERDVAHTVKPIRQVWPHIEDERGHSQSHYPKHGHQYT